MNTKKSLFSYKIFLLIFILTSTYTTYAQSNPEIISRTAKINSNCSVKVDSPGMPAEIISWAQNEIKVEYSLFLEGKTPEEKKLFLASFNRQLETQLKECPEGRVQATVQIRQINKNNNAIKIRIGDDSREYKLDKFEGKVKIFMPGSNPLAISSNFNSVTVGDFTSDVSIDLNSADFTLGTCKGLTVAMNFSGNSSAGKVEWADIACNSSTLSIQQVMKDISLDANFSNLSIGNVGNEASINLNSSSFTCGNLLKLSLNGNFVRNCKINHADVVEIDLNSSDFTAAKIRALNLKRVNFSTLRVAEANDVSISEAASTEFNFQKLGNLKVTEGNFCHFKIGTLSDLLLVNASSGDIKIDNVLAGFKSIDIKGNFVTTGIKMSATAEYSLYADLTFPDYDFGTLSLKKEKNDLNHQILRGQKGSPKAGASQIRLACQSCELSLK